MRLIALVLAVLALVSAWALSRPQPGQLPHPEVSMAQASESPGAVSPQAAGTTPTPWPDQAVSLAPELGTMTLTSLGLLALGLALRRRKRN